MKSSGSGRLRAGIDYREEYPVVCYQTGQIGRAHV